MAPTTHSRMARIRRIAYMPAVFAMILAVLIARLIVLVVTIVITILIVIGVGLFRV